MSALVAAPADYEDLPIIAPRIVQVEMSTGRSPAWSGPCGSPSNAGENEDSKLWLLFTPLTLAEVHGDIESALTSGSILVIWVGMCVDQNIHDRTGKPVLIGRTSILQKSAA